MDHRKSTLRDRIFSSIIGDMQPSAPTVHMKVGASTIVGGFLSLTLCGQFGVALTPFAGAMEGQIMGLMGIIGCSATCGLIFALLPVVLLRALTSPMQFHVLTRHHWGAVMGWMVASGGLFFVVRNQGALIDLLSWGLAAGAMYFSMAWALHHFRRLAT
jgi:hypothetical protein